MINQYKQKLLKLGIKKGKHVAFENTRIRIELMNCQKLAIVDWFSIQLSIWPSLFELADNLIVTFINMRYMIK